MPRVNKKSKKSLKVQDNEFNNSLGLKVSNIIEDEDFNNNLDQSFQPNNLTNNVSSHISSDVKNDQFYTQDIGQVKPIGGTLDINPEDNSSNQKNSFWLSGKIAISLIAFIIISGFILSYIFYKNTQSYAKSVKEKEAQELIANVNKLILLPSNEIPQVFDVEDPESLIKSQPFFFGSKKGDKVLVYMQSGKAIIYSPDRNVLVNVGPINIDQNNQINQATLPESRSVESGKVESQMVESGKVETVKEDQSRVNNTENINQENQ